MRTPKAARRASAKDGASEPSDFASPEPRGFASRAKVTGFRVPRCARPRNDDFEIFGFGAMAAATNSIIANRLDEQHHDRENHRD
jgi:hypothetical protein